MASESISSEKLETISVSGHATDSKTRIETTEGAFFIGDVASPLEHQLGTLAACVTVIGNLVAQEMGISINSLDISVEGDIDRRKYKGETEDGRAGFQDIHVAVTVEADEDEGTLQEWLEAVDERCPVSDNLQHETAASFSVVSK